MQIFYVRLTTTLVLWLSVQTYTQYEVVMSFITWDQIEQARQRYGNTGLPPVVDAAKTVLCGLNDQRFQFTNFDPTGLGNFLTGTWDRICDKPQPAPIDLAPKGRCEWDFRFSLPISEGFNPNPPPNKNYEFVVRSWATPQTFPEQSRVKIVFRAQNGDRVESFSTYGSFNSWEPAYGQATLISQVRVQCDSEPPEVAPPIPPLSPSPSPNAPNLTTTLPVKIAPNLIVPIAFVYVRPTVNLNVNAPVTFDIRPVIQLPDFNLNLTFDAGGVEFNFYAGGNGKPFPVPQPDPRPFPPSPPQEPSPPVDFDSILDLLNDIKDCSCPATQSQTIFLGRGRSGTFQLSPNTIGVILTLESFSPNAKKESGVDAPDVFYAGWFSFARQGHGGEREPINYSTNWFFRPEQSDSCWFTCRQGYTASVIAVVGT